MGGSPFGMNFIWGVSSGKRSSKLAIASCWLTRRLSGRQIPFDVGDLAFVALVGARRVASHDVGRADEYVELARVRPAPAIEQAPEREDHGSLDLGVPAVVQQELGVLPGADALAQRDAVARAEVRARRSRKWCCRMTYATVGRVKNTSGRLMVWYSRVVRGEPLGIVLLHIAHQRVVDEADAKVELDPPEAAQRIPGRALDIPAQQPARVDPGLEPAVRAGR